jgi:hypothetical protein
MVASAPSVPATCPEDLAPSPTGYTLTWLNGPPPIASKRRRMAESQITESKNCRHGRVPFPSPRSRAHTLTV